MKQTHSRTKPDVFVGDYAVIAEMLLEDMSEAQVQQFLDACEYLSMLPDRTIHALLAVYCQARQDYKITPDWVN